MDVSLCVKPPICLFSSLHFGLVKSQLAAEKGLLIKLKSNLVLNGALGFNKATSCGIIAERFHLV